MNRSRILLALLVLLGCALGYAWYSTPRQQSISPAAVRSTGSGDRSGEKIAVVDSVVLDFSGGDTLAFNEPERDLFRPLYRKPKFVPPPVVVKPPPVAIAPPPIMPPPVIRRPLANPLGPKPIPRLKVVGSLEKGAQRTVFLSSLQGDIYLVKRGDRFADGLIVRELSAQQVVISRNQNDQGVRLPLGKAKSQRLPDVPIRPDRPSPPPFSELNPAEAAPEIPRPERPMVPGKTQPEVE